MKSKILLTIALIMVLLAGCRKEEFIAEETDPNLRLEDIRSRLTPMEAKFFSIQGAARIASLQFRSEESEALVQGMINQLLILNADSPFVGDAIDRFGYPAWNTALILSDSSNAGKLIAVPLIKSGTDSTLAILMSAVNDNDSWANFFFPRNAVINHINGSLALDTEDQARLKFAASTISGHSFCGLGINWCQICHHFVQGR